MGKHDQPAIAEQGGSNLDHAPVGAATVLYLGKQASCKGMAVLSEQIVCALLHCALRDLHNSIHRDVF